MGYDMTCATPHEADRLAMEAINGGDRTAAEKHYDQLMKEYGYYRLNIWGMGAMRSAMIEVGALSTDSNPTPFDPKRESEEGYVKAWLSQGDGSGLIPIFKLTSNDGWLVTREEILGSVKLMADKECPVQEIGEEWVTWIAFLTHCSNHGGFRVH